MKMGGGFGNHIKIDYGDGIIVTYGHLAKGTVKVKENDNITYGQVIARMGHSGQSTGMHLHFEMRLNGSVIDPEEYIDPKNPRPANNSSNLIQFIYKGSTPEMSSDGTKYKMYDDGGGVPTIGAADINYSSHYSMFPDDVQKYIAEKLGSSNGVNNSGKSISSLNIYVDKEIVDKVGYQLLQGNVQFVERKVNGLALEQYQKDALVAATYHYGQGGVKIDGFISAYKTYGSDIGLWNNWWYNNGFTYYNNAKGKFKGWLAQNEYRYELFTTGNYDLPLYGRKYKYYTQDQIRSLGF